MGQINTNNYPTVNSLLDADLLIVENATNGTGTTTPKQLRENAIGTGTLQTSAQTVTGAINELKHEIDLGAGVARYDVNTITSGYLGQFSGSANLLLLHLTTDGTADATNGYMMMLSYSRPVARFAYGRLVDTGGAAYKQDVYADNTIICTISGSGEGTESDPVQVVILGIINAGFMLTPTAVVSDRDIQDGQGNTLSVLAEALTKTASGNPVVISDCAGGKARSLITEINAIQDLHGYDEPWAGGAGKNKLPMTVSAIKAANTTGTWTGNVYAISNGTFEILTDTANNVTGIKANGTFNSTVTFLIDSTYKTLSDMFGSGDFKLSQGIINTWTSSSSGLALQKQEAGSNINIPVNGTEISFSATGTDHYRPMLRFYSGELADNAVFLPMVRVSTESADFAPYSNICPISGRTAVVITRSDGDEISEDFTIQLGTTVYGADINWDTGVITVNDISITFDGSGDEGWSRYNQGSASAYAMQIDNTTGNSDTNVRPMTNGASGLNSSDTYGNYDCFISTSHGANWIAGRRGISTVEDWKTWLASNPIQVCYKLATPTTLQLTPTMLEMLKGYNRVTIESGSIELGYIAKLT